MCGLTEGDSWSMVKKKKDHVLMPFLNRPVPTKRNASHGLTMTQSYPSMLPGSCSDLKVLALRARQYMDFYKIYIFKLAIGADLYESC